MRVKRLAAYAAVAVLALGGVSACGGDDDDAGSGPDVKKDVTFEAGTTMDKLSKAKKLRVGTKFDQPGFGLKGLDGKPAGFDVEIAKIVAAELGISADQIEYSEAPSTVREQVIEQDKVDIVVATYTINDKRKERISFAGPYYEAGQTILVRADETGITGPDSFKAGGKKVCSVSNSTPAGNIKKYLQNEATQLVLFDTYQKCIDAINSKQVDAVTTDNVILLGFISTNEGKFKLAGDTFTKEPYGIGLKKDDTKFRNWINDVLEKAYADGRYAKAWQDSAGKIKDAKLPSPPAVNRY
ncbi:glutamate-binding protein [Virgisporangium aliadipatigenens]|uniref:Glutamate-binding protein n=1 Tax=Virgisporangium aliadipatigenens TaxID=741659 RepID=A0A8J3YKS6_9ACTN|nr:glutamate ABC transporter substrate-binding protein [Virgisporangium aliadipatigenens]GIJ45933.1 glutamate-binding protein [Virgisporangium aliadipatigenens]